ncbi:MAG TPA: hypothetical protein VFO41_08135 [Alphaproteobacteria bacterium]|nr:hypothetical protein [Alphaproteobacteria bacterium]
MRFQIWPAVSVAVIALMSTVAAADEEVYRAVVADHGKPTVRVIDLADGTALATFETVAPAVVAKGTSGRFVYALQRDGDRIDVIDGGAWLEGHGDHTDLRTAEPAKLAAGLEGGKPVHFVPHDGRIAAFFDDDGAAQVFSEATFHGGGAPEVETVRTAAAHHGVVVTVGNHVLVSVPHPEDSDALPIGIEVRDAAGVPVGEPHSCPDLHGEASAGNLVAFACATGLLLAEPTADGIDVAFVPYPDNLPGGKITTLRGGSDIQLFLGNFGADGVTVFDPFERSFAFARLPVRRVDFLLDPANSGQAFILTEDGRLHRFDTLAARLEASAEVTGPYSMHGHWSDPRPRLAKAGGMVVLTDPDRGDLVLVDARTLRVDHRLAIGGTPYSIAVVGGTGEAH